MAWPPICRTLLLAALGCGCCLWPASARSSKLNVPRVLLPYSEEGVDFVLESDDEQGGCFKWKSSRPEAVTVTPLSPDLSRGCSARATVSPAKSRSSSTQPMSSSSLAKVQSVITAEDVNSPGHILRCDVIVDTLRSLQIVTRTHELFLEEAPEEFYVRAYDGQGNEFTTVRKMIFKWTIENTVKRPGGGTATATASPASSENIRFISFRDSTYAFDDSLRSIESAGGQGEKVLLEGIKTGSSKVAVRPVAALYASRVQPAEVNVMVVANLYLVPASAYIMMKATIAYKAEQIKSNRVFPIELPSHQYYLTVEDDKLAALDSNTATVSGQAYGSTEVMLRDANVAPDDQTVRPPAGDLHVVEPASIAISVNPHKNWNVIVGRQYEIVVDIYDSENNVIYPSDNVEVEFSIDKKLFSVKQSTENGTHHSGVPSMAGTAKVEASLLGVIDPETNALLPLAQSLHATGELRIFDEISLSPSLSVFPWDPINNPSYSVEYAVVGADPDLSFQWHSSNAQVATVTQHGVGRTGRGEKATLGESTVTAAMHRASHNFGSARIMIVPVTGLAILDSVVEAEVGAALPLPVSMTGVHEGKELTFTQCHMLPLESAVVDGKIYQESGSQLNLRDSSLMDLPQEACTALSLKALNPGFTVVSVSYTPPSAGSEKYSEKATIAAYKRLQPDQPASGKTLLGIDSSFQAVWTGGPLPWVNKPDMHFHKLIVQDLDVVKASSRLSLRTGSQPSSPAAAVYAFEVSCLRKGRTQVTLEVGNRKSATLQRPVVTRSSITVECGHPSSLELSPDGPQPTGLIGSCPLAARSGRIPAVCYQDLPIRVAAFDSEGRRFDNFSSEALRWSTEEQAGEAGQTTGAKLKLARGLDHSGLKHPTLGYRLLEDGLQMLEVSPEHGSGAIDVIGEMDGGMLGFGSVRGELKLDLVQDATLDSNLVSVFNHPNNVESVRVQDGSGYFEVYNSNSGVAESGFVPHNQSVRVHPLKDGEATLTLRDLCLTSRRNPSLRIHVSGVHKVDVLVNDKVQKGNKLTAEVRLLDRHGKALAASALRFLQVNLQAASSSIAKVLPRDPSVTDLHFVVEGTELGETSLSASAAPFGDASAPVRSAQQPLQVFPPLELDPRNITLIIGAKFQVKTLGGPMPDATIEFSVDNNKIASSDSEGLIEALTLGHSRLTASAVETDRANSRKAVLSEDSVDVHVVKFHGVRVVVPVQRLRVGAEMPVKVVGLDQGNQNTFSFATAMPKVKLQWSATNQDAADLVGVFHRSGVSPGSDNEGVMRLIAKKPGRVTIKVKAKISETIPGMDQYQFDNDRTFEHQVEVQVFEDLHLMSPRLPGRDTLLLAPGAEFQLATNRDRGGARRVTYTALQQDAVTVSASGLVRAGRSVGSAIIQVEAVEDFGVVQRTSLVVEVKPVHYMMINAMKAFAPHPGSKLAHLPRGLSLPLSLSFHDNSGARFDSVGADTDYRPSRFDSVVITEANNKTLNVELAKEEFTVLKAWGGGLEDFVVFNVEKGIAPVSLDLALVGDHIDLDNLVVGAHADNPGSGLWTAEPAGMASIHPETGVASLLRSGSVRFSFFPDDEAVAGVGGVSGSPQRRRTTLDVEAKEPTRLALSPIKLLTRTRKDQFVPFSAMGDNGAGSIARNFHAAGGKMTGETPVDSKDPVVPSELFDCRAAFLADDEKLSDYFAVDAVFNFELRSHACRFAPLQPLFQSHASVLEGQVHLEVVPKYPSKLRNIKSDSIDFKFLSGFHVVSEKVELSNVDPSAQLRIHGAASVLSAVNVAPSHEEYLTVGKTRSDGASAIAVTVYLDSQFWQHLKLEPEKKSENIYFTVSSSLTSQSVRVPVQVNFSPEGSCGVGGGGSGELGWASLFYFLMAHYQAVAFCLLSCLACVVATKAFLRKEAAARAAGGATTSMKPILGPLQGTPVAQVGSPLNLTNADNKPYLWTVDNSPVYGSPDVRRRGSPRSLTQYSYSDM